MKILPYIITLAAGFIIAILFFKSCHKDPVAPVIISPKELVKTVIQKEKENFVKIDSFLRIENSLRKSAESLKYSYADLQKRNVLLSIKADSLAQLVPVANDYEQGNKEALIRTIDILYENEIIKDSLCTAQVSTLENVVMVNKKIITGKDSLYANLRRSFDTAIDNNLKILDFTKFQKKEIRRRKVGAFVWKVAAIGAGLFIVKQSL